jgi:hypothetical protein
MAQTVPITKTQFLVTLKGLDYYWETFSGLDDQAQTSDYSDGLSNRVYKLVGPRTLQDMTLTKAFDPLRDKPIIDWHRNYCDGVNASETVSITPVRYCPKPEPIGAALILYGVKPVGLKGFEVDKKSNDIVMLTLAIIADDYTYA